MIFLLSIMGLSLTPSHNAIGALHALVTPGPLDSSSCIFRGDAMILQILDGHRRVITHHYCSAYGRGAAHLVADARGHLYVFLNHSITHGTHASSDLLTIYRLRRTLVQRAEIPARIPIGTFRDANYRYQIRKPRRGGLELIGSVRVTGKPGPYDVSPDPAPGATIDVPRAKVRRANRSHHLGSRFSRKALIPSSASAASMFSTITREAQS